MEGRLLKRDPQLSTPNPAPQILHPKSYTPNPKPQTPNLEPQTPNLEPQTPNPDRALRPHRVSFLVRLAAATNQPGRRLGSA